MAERDMPVCECAAYGGLLAAYVDGEVTSAEALAVNAHLDACPACREDVRALREVSALLSAAPEVSPPEGLRQAILTATVDRPPLLQRLLESVRVPRLAVAAAAAAGVCTVLLSRHLAPPGPPASPVPRAPRVAQVPRAALPGPPTAANRAVPSLEPTASPPATFGPERVAQAAGRPPKESPIEEAPAGTPAGPPPRNAHRPAVEPASTPVVDMERPIVAAVPPLPEPGAEADNPPQSDPASPPGDSRGRGGRVALLPDVPPPAEPESPHSTAEEVHGSESIAGGGKEGTPPESEPIFAARERVAALPARPAGIEVEEYRRYLRDLQTRFGASGPRTVRVPVVRVHFQ